LFVACQPRSYGRRTSLIVGCLGQLPQNDGGAFRPPEALIWSDSWTAFVVKSGDGAPHDNQGTFCLNFQADARDPSSWRRELPDGPRELPTAAPPLSSRSPPRWPHTPDTPPAHASVRDRPRPTRPGRGRPPHRRGDQPHALACARVWVPPPAAAPPVTRDIAWSKAAPPPGGRGGSVDGGPARCGASSLLAPTTV